jgi:hypothetical protein
VITRRAHGDGVVIVYVNLCAQVREVLLHTELPHFGKFAASIADATSLVQVQGAQETRPVEGRSLDGLEDEDTPLVARPVRSRSECRPLVLFNSFDGSFVSVDTARNSDDKDDDDSEAQTDLSTV